MALIQHTTRSVATAIKMVRKGNWRDAMILLDKKSGVGYFDFSKASQEDLGLGKENANPHQGSGYELDCLLKQLDITADDAIIDIGCGKGHAMVIMAKYAFRQIAGVDLSPDLIQVAKKNLSRLGLRGRTRLFCRDATAFTELDDYSHIYFFNPFPCQVMPSVMKNIEASLSRKPRDLKIIYNRPNCDAEALRGGVFKKIAEYRFFGDKTLLYVYANRVD
jgi:SAM-dependent methyltransferase